MCKSHLIQSDSLPPNAEDGLKPVQMLSEYPMIARPYTRSLSAGKYGHRCKQNLRPDSQT
ncbi:hypothetical protein METBIDRAFT_33871, partial [Metschnikowia bicuspidata var. bicuspidata NRRL YB-4993]